MRYLVVLSTCCSKYSWYSRWRTRERGAWSDAILSNGDNIYIISTRRRKEQKKERRKRWQITHNRVQRIYRNLFNEFRNSRYLVVFITW